MDIDGKPSDPKSETLNELAQINAGAEVPTSDPVPAADAAPPVNNSEPAPPVTAEPGAEPVTPQITTPDGQSFATEAEAYAHVQGKLAASETENTLLQARQEGYDAAAQGIQPAQPAVPVPPPADDFNEDAYYADPVGYMKERETKLAANVREDIRRETAAANADQTAWKDFFIAHPDLDGFQEDCQSMLNQHLNTIQILSRKDKKQAMQFLATKTREKFQNWNAKQRPTETLTNAQTPPAGGSGGGTVTPQDPNKDVELVDFCAEISSMNN